MNRTGSSPTRSILDARVYLATLAVVAVSPVLAKAQTAFLRPLDSRLTEARSRGLFEPPASAEKRIGPDLSVSVIDQARPFHRRTGTGFAVGTTVAAVALSASLGWSACTGSGDYLRTCRYVYVGGAAVGGGLGALVGHAVKRDTPPGAALWVVRGGMLGALGVFAVSLLVCEQADQSNPRLVCGRHGMPTAVTTAAYALAGGLVSYVIGAIRPRKAVSR